MIDIILLEQLNILPNTVFNQKPVLILLKGSTAAAHTTLSRQNNKLNE